MLRALLLLLLLLAGIIIIIFFLERTYLLGTDFAHVIIFWRHIFMFVLTFYSEFVGIFTIYPHTKFHTPNSVGELDIAMKLRNK
jgi:hypothetical protein